MLATSDLQRIVVVGGPPIRQGSGFKDVYTIALPMASERVGAAATPGGGGTLSAVAKADI